MNRLFYIILTWAVVCGWIFTPWPTAAGQEFDPNGGRTQAADEAFATYVGWAAEDLKAGDAFKLRLGRAELPVTHAHIAGSSGFIEAIENINPGRASDIDADQTETISGIGLTLSLPAGISAAVLYGSDRREDNRSLFDGYARDLDLRLNRSGVAHAFGGSLRWQTPFEGLTLKGAVSQMQLSADAVARSVPRWTAPGLDRSSMRGSLFSTSRAWRAGAEQTIGDFKLSAEYVQNRVDTRFGDNARLGQIGEGYSGRLAYRINDWLRVGSSYSVYFADRDDRSGDNLADIGMDPARAWIQDIGVSARFDLSSRMALHLEGHLMNGLLGVAEGTDEDWRRFGARMTINF